MTITKEQLDIYFAATGSTASSWHKTAMKLYPKSLSNRLTNAEKAAWQRIQDRNYIDFADTPEAQIKIEFLDVYLKAGISLQLEYHYKAIKVFTPGQFAVIAVRLHSIQILDLGVDHFIDYLSKSHDYNLITELKLLYNSAILLNQYPEDYIQQHMPKIKDEWCYSFVQGFLNQDITEKLNSGYKGVYEPNFGYIKEQKQDTTSTSKNNNGKKYYMENNIYSPEYVKGLFNRMSSSYERMNYITSFGFSIRWRRQFLEPFKGSNQKVEILDLLTGMGETWHATKSKFPNATLTVLDFSNGMLKFAIQRNKVKFNNEIKILLQDILNNELPGNHYDFVTCAFGLKTFDNEQLKKLALETKRILKQGGQFSFIEVSKPGNKILQALYGFYLGKIIPILGRILLGNPEEYKMLWKYTDKFDNAKLAAEIFKSAGLITNFSSYFYGCASGFNGTKTDK